MTSFDAANKLSYYMLSVLEATKPSSDSPQFDAWSYSVWAVGDIIECLSESPLDDYEFILSDYILQTEEFKRMSQGSLAYDVFNAVNETAIDILRYLKEMYKGVI